MSIRDRAQAAPASRTMSEPFVAPWPGEDGADEMIAVRDLGSDARVAFMSAVDAKAETVDMSVLLPYVTDLIVDPTSGDPAFELADHDWLVERHPGLISKAIMTAIKVSDLGDVAEQAIEGNSEPTPN